MFRSVNPHIRDFLSLAFSFLRTILIIQGIHSRLDNRLAEGITISCKSISAVVPAEEYNLPAGRQVQL